jgi:putative DNA primase/helicase
MNFEQFAQSHGLIIRDLVAGRIVRCATESKPLHKNGAFFFDGDWGWIQDHALHTEIVLWKSDKIVDTAALAARMAESRKTYAKERKQAQAAAAQKAQSIIKQSKFEQHAYLDKKGWPDMTGLVYYPDENTNLLAIPMRVNGAVVGCQLINKDGDKKFLFGQRCNGAEYLIDGGGVDVWCEGYATGLSIRAVMAAIKARCSIHVCFSAGNMQAMATAAGRGFVVADNDASTTGEKSAQATGLPYFMPPDAGSDFNDYHKGAGLFVASQALRRFMQQWSSAPSQGAATKYPARG